MAQLDQPNPNYQPKDEVDIIDVMRYCFNGVKSLLTWLWGAITTCIIFLLRKSLYILLFVALGTGLCWVWYLSTPKSYKSEAIISSNNLENSIIINEIGRLNYLFSIKNYSEIAKLLRISEQDASKIIYLKTYYGISLKGQQNIMLPASYVEDFDWKDTTFAISNRYFKVETCVLDEDVYPTLSTGLTTYMSSNTFGDESNSFRNEQIKQQISNTINEIATLQSLLVNYNNRGVTTPQLVLEGAPKKSELTQLQENISMLNERKILLEREAILFQNPITLISDFSKTYRPATRLRDYLAYGAIAGFVLGIVGLLVWDNRKRIAAVMREKK